MNLWQLKDAHARFVNGPLQAQVDLLRPSLGMHDLVWDAAPVAGNLLGVTVAEEPAPPGALSTEGVERYVRGSDLVANYPQSQSQRFTLQVYWRATVGTVDSLVIEAIVSLQTSLLECFPKALLSTMLPSGDVLAVPGDGTPAVMVADRLASDEPAGVLVRGDGCDWSYIELTHPSDLGRWRVMRDQGTRIERELGGDFQEKGVIRRLRVRGAFVRRERDLDAAMALMTDFAVSPAPLTA